MLDLCCQFLSPHPSVNVRFYSVSAVVSPTSLQSHRAADGEMHHFPQQWTEASAAPSTQHGALSATVSPTQYTASFSVAPAVQLQPAVSTAVSAVQPGQLKPSSPVINAPHAGSGGQSSTLQSHSGPQCCPSSPVSAQSHTPVPLATHILVCDSSQDQQLSSGECVSSSSEESGDCMSEDDELDRVDTMPVRDTSCQTSIDKHTVMLKYNSKSGSPVKTARKVMTVKYLLGELKALVANQGEWCEIAVSAVSAISVLLYVSQPAKQTR